MTAYVYPILGIFWSMLIFVGLLLLLFMIIWCFVDNFRRRDHHGWAKLGWTLLIVFIPLLGALIYIVARPSDVDNR
jgi:Phospholipase_D-nuclease N-terminal